MLMSLRGEGRRGCGAGQGVVQFARGITDQLDYAVKFFVSKRAFDEEGDFYKSSPLGPLLPKCLALCGNEDGKETDAHGIPLPPLLIMERGEALDEWNRRAKPDNFQAVAVCPSPPQWALLPGSCLRCSARVTCALLPMLGDLQSRMMELRILSVACVGECSF
jgi:hypothetical protein